MPSERGARGAKQDGAATPDPERPELNPSDEDSEYEAMRRWPDWHLAMSRTRLRYRPHSAYSMLLLRACSMPRKAAAANPCRAQVQERQASPTACVHVCRAKERRMTGRGRRVSARSRETPSPAQPRPARKRPRPAPKQQKEPKHVAQLGSAISGAAPDAAAAAPQQAAGAPPAAQPAAPSDPSAPQQQPQPAAATAAAAAAAAELPAAPGVSDAAPELGSRLQSEAEETQEAEEEEEEEDEPQPEPVGELCDQSHTECGTACRVSAGLTVAMQREAEVLLNPAVWLATLPGTPRRPV